MDRYFRGQSISDLLYSDTDPRYSPPLSARISRSVDNIYNFFGLYFVSLFSVRVFTT
jgi:hypothetical protein